MAEPIEVLPALLSLDITAGLVAQGLRAPWTAGAEMGDAAVYTVSVLDASNTSPIVITVASGFGRNLAPRQGRTYHLVVAGVTGNTAANKQDPETLRNEAWVAVVTSAETDANTTLALYDIDNNTGELVASEGNGAYVSGGTVSIGLIDGKILVGRENIGEFSAAPRIVMIPTRNRFSPWDGASSWTEAAIDEGETEREELAPPIRTELLWYETHVWGEYPGSSLRSFGVCQRMYHQIIRSAQTRCSGVYETSDGTYIDQEEGAVQRLKYGHEYVFSVGLAMPVKRDAVTYAPDDTALEADLYMSINGGEPEPVNEEA